jgi:hypothetical protein
VAVDRDDEVDEYEPISCDEPHEGEFAGLASTNFDSGIPGDPELVEVCARVVGALVDGDPSRCV